MAKGVVNDAQKKALLLHTAGIEVQELYETLTDPGPGAGVEEDTATEFDKTLRTLNAYFATKLNEPYERHVFRNMAQQEGETVDQFIAKLRKQAQNCNFTDPDVDIRDQVIDRCRSSALRRKLLGKEDLTLKKVQEVARAMEAVDLQAKKMGAHGFESKTEEPMGVNKVSRKSSSKPVKQSQRSQVKAKGDATDVVKRGIMAEIEFVQLVKQCVQSVTRWVILQRCVKQSLVVMLWVETV